MANNWFHSYLQIRKQYVIINNTKSTLTNIKYGVPQGLVLRPLLFLIYISDLSQSTQHSTVFHFADDTAPFQSNSSLKALNRYINHDLHLLCDWLRANKISLNVNKTEIVLFRSKNKQITRKLNFRISGQKIHPSKFVKYLDVFIDEHLEWKTHIMQLLPKLEYANGMLSKIRHYVARQTLCSIYHSIFLSHMTYACQVWFQSKNTLTNQTSFLQNKALKIINFKNNRFNSSQLYKNSKILKINDHVNLKNCLFV